MKLNDSLTDELFDDTELPLQVCKSGAGYYIGQMEPSGCPYSRLSDYYPTQEDAEQGLELEFPLREVVENERLIRELTEKGVIRPMFPIKNSSLIEIMGSLLIEEEEE